MPIRKRGKFCAFEFWLDGRYYSGTFNGKKGLERCEDINDARYQLAIVRKKIRDGERPDRNREELKDFATFVDRVYLPFAKAHHSSPRHAEFRCEMLKKHFAGKRFDEITPMAVVRFIDRRLESRTVRKEVLRDGRKVNKERSPTTVNKEVTLLSSIFHMAIGEGVTTKNPCVNLPKSTRARIPARRKRNRRLSPDEERRLFDVGLQGRRGHLYDIAEIALLTGMRKGELLRLEPGHVNLGMSVKTFVIKGEKINVPPNWLIITKSKTGKPRVIPMSRRVRRKLEALCTDATCGKYVFTSARTGGRITDIKRGWKSACEAAEIDDLRFHDLRHEWSSRAADCGVPEHVRRDILGHSAGSMTGDYTHAPLEMMEEAMELVAVYQPRKLPVTTKWQDKIAG
ncbi:MAG: site-specific integrase [Acidobacteriota bacterium]|nr:site-specific integrase [Acidobacteriota bacterium]